MNTKGMLLYWHLALVAMVTGFIHISVLSADAHAPLKVFRLYRN